MVSRPDSGWDLSVENRSGQLVLVVEVKRKTHVSPEWATKLRRNILAHGTFAKAPYFLMVFPDKFYLWTEVDQDQSEPTYTEPTYTIDALPILQPYLERARLTAEQISGESLELIVSSWLGEIIHAEHFADNIDPSQQWLLESGLYAALAGGKFEYGAAA